jgi:hypothetical protein
MSGFYMELQNIEDNLNRISSSSKKTCEQTQNFYDKLCEECLSVEKSI